MKKLFSYLAPHTSYLVLFYLLSPLFASAQKTVEADAKVDFVTHYVWRGTDVGGVYIQPSGALKWQGLSLKMAASTPLAKEDPTEIDITLGYTLGPVNIGVTDYWMTGNDYDGRNLYFSYEAERGAHQFEGNIGFTCRYFSLQGYTMFWGNDFKYDNPDNALSREQGKRAFSTYIELNIPFYMAGLDWVLRGGMTPFESANTIVPTTVVNGIQHYQKEHFYADGPRCISASLRATKNFELGDIKVPVFFEFNSNPYLQTAYFIVGMSVIPF